MLPHLGSSTLPFRSLPQPTRLSHRPLPSPSKKRKTEQQPERFCSQQSPLIFVRNLFWEKTTTVALTFQLEINHINFDSIGLADGIK